MGDWVSFEEVKKAISIQQVLEHYGLALRRSGDNLVGPCPVCKSGQGSRHFSVNPDKNAWQCFKCKAHGNQLDLTAALENISVRDAALKLAQVFKLDVATEKPADYVPSRERKKERAAEKKPEPPPKTKPETVPANVDEAEEGTNPPLGFALKNLQSDHDYVQARGITEETARHFGLGYFGGKGIMHNRICIPIHNERGELVAYCGRWPADSGWPEGKDKYELPVGFKKTLELFNLHRAVATGSKVAILVEGYFGTKKIHQAGFPFVVALMGSSMSAAQEKLLVEHFEYVILMLDGDDAGRKGTEDIALRLARKLYVRIVDLPDGVQPDKLSEEEIQDILGSLP